MRKFLILIMIFFIFTINNYGQSDSILNDYILRIGNELRFNSIKYKKQSEKYSDIINLASEKYNIPVSIIEAVITVESRWCPKAKGTSECNGLMQIKGGSFNPKKNIMSGTGILRHYIDLFNGNIDLGLTAYNRGQGGARKYFRKHQHPSNYAIRVAKISERIEMYKIMAAHFKSMENNYFTYNNFRGEKEMENKKSKTENKKNPELGGVKQDENPEQAINLMANENLLSKKAQERREIAQILVDALRSKVLAEISEFEVLHNVKIGISPALNRQDISQIVHFALANPQIEFVNFKTDKMSFTLDFNDAAKIE